MDCLFRKIQTEYVDVPLPRPPPFPPTSPIWMVISIMLLMCACVLVCVIACVRACVRNCVRAYVLVCVSYYMSLRNPSSNPFFFIVSPVLALSDRPLLPSVFSFPRLCPPPPPTPKAWPDCSDLNQQGGAINPNQFHFVAPILRLSVIIFTPTGINWFMMNGKATRNYSEQWALFWVSADSLYCRRFCFRKD